MDSVRRDFMNDDSHTADDELEQTDYEENIVDIRGRPVAVSERSSHRKNRGTSVCRIQAWAMFYKGMTGNEIYTRDDVLECFYRAMECLRCEENYLDLSAEQASILVNEGDYFIKTGNGEHFIPIISYADLRDVLKHTIGGTRVDELFQQFCEKNLISVNESLEDIIDLELLDYSIAANK